MERAFLYFYPNEKLLLCANFTLVELKAKRKKNTPIGSGELEKGTKIQDSQQSSCPIGRELKDNQSCKEEKKDQLKLISGFTGKWIVLLVSSHAESSPNSKKATVVTGESAHELIAK